LHPQSDFILGEYPRALDERFRLSLPPEFVEPLTAGTNQCIVAKERPGCLSVWNAAAWQTRLEQGVELVKGKIRAGKLEGRWVDVQRLGRLLSTRHRTVEIGDRGRLLIPESFRSFLAVEPGGEVLVVGAAVCVEIWKPERWLAHLETHLEEFPKLFDELSG
jgi:MraZ protein